MVCRSRDAECCVENPKKDDLCPAGQERLISRFCAYKSKEASESMLTVGQQEALKLCIGDKNVHSCTKKNCCFSFTRMRVVDIPSAAAAKEDPHTSCDVFHCGLGFVANTSYTPDECEESKNTSVCRQFEDIEMAIRANKLCFVCDDCRDRFEKKKTKRIMADTVNKKGELKKGVIDEINWKCSDPTGMGRAEPRLPTLEIKDKLNKDIRRCYGVVTSARDGLATVRCLMASEDESESKEKYVVRQILCQVPKGLTRNNKADGSCRARKSKAEMKARNKRDKKGPYGRSGLT